MCKEPLESLTVLDSCASDSPRLKQVMKFVRDRGFADATIESMCSKQVPAPPYAVMLSSNAMSIANAKKEEEESIMILSVLKAFEKATRSTGSRFTMLNYELNREGIRLVREETVALFTTPEWWRQNKERNAFPYRNKLAAVMYCAEAFTDLATIPAKTSLPVATMPEDLVKKYDACWPSEGVNKEPNAILFDLINAFVPAFVGAEKQNKIDELIGWLTESDFFLAPAGPDSTLDYVGGLADHILWVIMQQRSIQTPKTDAEMGELVLTAICHGLYMTDAALPYFKVKKFYHPELNGASELPDGYAREPDGRVYCKEKIEAFTLDNPFAIPDEALSVHKAVYLLGDALTPRMAEAIDAHRRDKASNPHVDAILFSNSLALFLHMATVMASWYAEVIL